jgi:hypothetical protein
LPQRASFRPRLATEPLPVATVSTTSSRQDSHLQATAHAARTSWEGPGECRGPPRVADGARPLARRLHALIQGERLILAGYTAWKLKDSPMRKPTERSPVSHLSLRGRLRRKVHRVRHGMVSTIRPYPRIFLPYASLAGAPQALRIRPQTEIVIEGFERSGNTFAVIAFSRSQPHPVEVAHHLHAAAQVIEAARRGIPALVLFRRPEEAILSFMLFHPALAASQAMRTYLRFYSPLLPYKDRFVLARFETVISDFGSVIHCVNEKFGTEFAEFDHREANVRESFMRMDRDERAKLGKLWVEETVARPSAWREEAKEAIRSQFHDGALSKLRSQVFQVYAACDSLADV